MPNNCSRVLFALSFFISLNAYAELIKLNSGQQVEGKILKEEKDSILVDAGIDTPVTYFRDEIKEITADLKPSDLPVDPQLRLQADALEAQALELIDTNKMTEGLAKIRQAIGMDPSPHRLMNYGSILFGNGVAQYRKGMIDDAKIILRDAQTQLNKAIEGFNKTNDAAFIGQSYFLLGEIESNAFNNLTKAKEYYTQAVSICAHDSAKAALAKLPLDFQKP